MYFSYNTGYVFRIFENKDKTTFTFHVGIYKYNRIPFGLINAP